MKCERCGNADADYECRMCGFTFCAGCVDLAEYPMNDATCWDCLGIEPDEDEEE